VSRDNAAGPGRAARRGACRSFVGSGTRPNLGRDAIRCPKDGRDPGHVHDLIDRLERDPWTIPALELSQRVHAYADAIGELLLRKAEALAGTGDQLGERVWGHGRIGWWCEKHTTLAGRLQPLYVLFRQYIVDYNRTYANFYSIRCARVYPRMPTAVRCAAGDRRSRCRTSYPRLPAPGHAPGL
jgi:hypothetical protein